MGEALRRLIGGNRYAAEAPAGPLDLATVHPPAAVSVLRDPATPAPIAALVGMGLTPRQAEIFLYLFTETAKNGYQPSTRDVMLVTGIKSTNGVTCHLQYLAHKGWIDGTAGRGEARRLTFLRRPDGGPFLGFAAITEE